MNACSYQKYGFQLDNSRKMKLFYWSKKLKSIFLNNLHLLLSFQCLKFFILPRKIILGHSVNMYSFSLQLEMSVSIKGDTQMLEFGNEIYRIMRFEASSNPPIRKRNYSNSFSLIFDYNNSRIPRNEDNVHAQRQAKKKFQAL